MGWQDNLREASFRKVQFFVEQATNNGGRKLSINNFPQQDYPVVQDFGKATKVYKMRGYLVGENYFSQRNIMIEALDKEGIGKLIHPYLGELDVYVQSWDMDENATNGRMVYFEMNYILAKTFKLEQGKITRLDTIEAAKSTLEKIQDAFDKAYSILSLPSNKVNDGINALSSVGTIIKSARKLVALDATFQQKVDVLIDEADRLVLSASELSLQVLDVLTYGMTPIDPNNPLTPENAKPTFNEYTKIINDGITGEEGDPDFLISTLVNQMAIVSQAQLTATMEYDSLTDANDYRRRTFDNIDTFLFEDNLPDDVYTETRNLKTTITEDIKVRGADLAQLVEITTNKKKPSLVLSYELYGTIDEEEDINKRNNIKHPGFSGGQDVIEVVTNV